jgi:hypothetical protein
MVRAARCAGAGGARPPARGGWYAPGRFRRPGRLRAVSVAMARPWSERPRRRVDLHPAAHVLGPLDAIPAGAPIRARTSPARFVSSVCVTSRLRGTGSRRSAARVRVLPTMSGGDADETRTGAVVRPARTWSGALVAPAGSEPDRTRARASARPGRCSRARCRPRGQAPPAERERASYVRVCRLVTVMPGRVDTPTEGPVGCVD